MEKIDRNDIMQKRIKELMNEKKEDLAKKLAESEFEIAEYISENKEMKEVIETLEKIAKNPALSKQVESLETAIEELKDSNKALAEVGKDLEGLSEYWKERYADTQDHLFLMEKDLKRFQDNETPAKLIAIKKMKERVENELKSGLGSELGSILEKMLNNK